MCPHIKECNKLFFSMFIPPSKVLRDSRPIFKCELTIIGNIIRWISQDKVDTLIPYFQYLCVEIPMNEVNTVLLFPLIIDSLNESIKFRMNFVLLVCFPLSII